MGHIPPLWTRHSIFGSDPLFSSLVPFCIQVGTRWLIAVRANGRISTERYRQPSGISGCSSLSLKRVKWQSIIYAKLPHDKLLSERPNLD